MDGAERAKMFSAAEGHQNECLIWSTEKENKPPNAVEGVVSLRRRRWCLRLSKLEKGKKSCTYLPLTAVVSALHHCGTFELVVADEGKNHSTTRRTKSSYYGRGWVIAGPSSGTVLEPGNFSYGF